MKKLLFFSFIVSLFCLSTETFAQATICGQFHKKHCVFETGDDDDGDEFFYNAQSKSGLFAQGSTSRMRCTIYRGMDYRITVCCETSLGEQLVFKITDAKTKEMLYDNSTDENKKQFEFQSNSTRQLVIEVAVPAGETKAEKGKAANASCVGLLIEHKKTDRVGF